MADRIGWVCPDCGTARPPAITECGTANVPHGQAAAPQAAVAGPVADVVASSTKAKAPKKPKRLDYNDYPLFVEFWNRYPQHRDKAAALAAWVTATDAGAVPQVLIAAAAKYAAWCRVNRVEQPHIKYAQGWLSHERWTDEIELPLEVGAIDFEAQRLQRIADEDRAIREAQ